MKIIVAWKRGGLSKVMKLPLTNKEKLLDEF
jgi:hypothetical protein